MRTHFSVAMLALMIAGVAPTPVHAQDDVAAEQAAVAAQERERRRQVPVEVVITVSRYLDDELVSSAPYALAINANGRPTNIRMGARVPVPNPMFAPRPAAPGQGPLAPSQYENVGSNVDGSAATIGDGIFHVALAIEETSIVFDEVDANPRGGTGLPVFRTFRASNEVTLSDGETVQFWSATDRTTGELIRVTASLRVLE